MSISCPMQKNLEHLISTDPSPHRCGCIWFIKNTIINCDLCVTFETSGSQEKVTNMNHSYSNSLCAKDEVAFFSAQRVRGIFPNVSQIFALLSPGPFLVLYVLTEIIPLAFICDTTFPKDTKTCF